MIKLCIFDLDGTLIDSAPDIQFSINTTFESFGLPPLDLSQTKAIIGKGVDNLIATKIPKEEATEQKLKDVKAMYIEHYSHHCTDKTIVYDGVHDVLRELQSRGIKMAIVSNKPHIYISKILADLLGDIEFSHAIGQGEYPHKPDPAAVLAIMKDLDVQCEECLYIGDSDTDMQTGVNAGVKTIGVSWGYRSVQLMEEAGADVIIDKAEELLGLITKSSSC